VSHFLKHNLDALFIATNAPERSVFNRVERKMAPLSRELAELILDHDHFGSHLDQAGRTTDLDLKKKIFCYAWNLLAQLWSAIVVDCYPTIAVYVDPDRGTLTSENLEKIPDKRWFAEHIMSSQYFTQVGNCASPVCCSASRSSYFALIPSHFLAAPIPLFQTIDGLKVPDNSKFNSPKIPSLFVTLHLLPVYHPILPRSNRSLKILFFCC